MALFLRLDVDKPYGNSNIPQRVVSKVREDLCFPAVGAMGYLWHVRAFMAVLKQHAIRATFYFRVCTAPQPGMLAHILDQGHQLGFHAEDTRTFDSFRQELRAFEAQIRPATVASFTKHGSGKRRLGRRHFPPYEPGKYATWAEKLGIAFASGNGILDSFQAHDNRAWREQAFWVDLEYRHPRASEVRDLVLSAKTSDFVVLEHPCNYFSRAQSHDEFERIARLAAEQGVEWGLL